MMNIGPLILENMKRTAVLFLFLFLVTIGGCQDKATVKEQQKKIDELSAKLKELSTENYLDAQDKCAKQAYVQFKQLGYDKNQAAVYSNHYSAKFNKCFLLIENTSTTASTTWIYKTLSDAFEGKVLGSYAWHTGDEKKDWEVASVMCEVSLPSGDKKNCKSEDEFKELIKTYMEDK